MLILSATTDTLEVLTSAAVTVDVHASYADHTTADDNVVAGRQNTAITTATTTTIVAAPSAGNIRNVKTLHIRNKHATTSVDVTVVFDQNATDFELHKVTLLAGETLEYIEGIGFFTITSPTAALVRVKKLTSDLSNSTTTSAEVTGLSMTTGLGTFKFEFWVLHQAAATTTGIDLSANHSGTVTQFDYWWQWTSANTASADGVMDQDIALTTGGMFNVNAARAKSATGFTSTGTVSHDTTNSDVLSLLSGICTVTVDGDLELWHASEVAFASTVKAGSSLILTRIGD